MKALIPAAGLGTRWYPWTRIVPKELLPLGNYPAIHYVLEETVAARIIEIGIIISKAKWLIKSYVEDIWVTNHPEIQIKWFYQIFPRGVGDALLCARRWVNGRPIAVLYPDEIHPKDGGISQISKAFEKHKSCWVGLTAKKKKQRQACIAIEKIEKNSLRVYGPVDQGFGDNVGYGTGRYILAHGFSHLDYNHFQSRSKEGQELEDSDIIAPLWGKDVRGIFLSEPIYDIGEPDNWSSAVSAF